MRNAIDVDVCDLMARHFTLTIRLNRLREFRIRCFLAGVLFRMGVRVLGAKVNVSHEE